MLVPSLCDISHFSVKRSHLSRCHQCVVHEIWLCECFYLLAGNLPLVQQLLLISVSTNLCCEDTPINQGFGGDKTSDNACFTHLSNSWTMLMLNTNIRVSHCCLVLRWFQMRSISLLMLLLALCKVLLGATFWGQLSWGGDCSGLKENVWRPTLVFLTVKPALPKLNLRFFHSCILMRKCTYNLQPFPTSLLRYIRSGSTGVLDVNNWNVNINKIILQRRQEGTINMPSQD